MCTYSSVKSPDAHGVAVHLYKSKLTCMVSTDLHLGAVCVREDMQLHVCVCG